MGVVDVDFHQFSVANGTWDDEPLQANRACLVFEPRTSRVAVLSGIATGPVTVETQALTSPPSGVADGWEDVAEVSLTISDRPLEVVGWNQALGEDARLDTSGPGTYRLRVHASGRDTAPDRSVLEPVEQYLIQAWPAPHAPSVTIRAGSAAAREEPYAD